MHFSSPIITGKLIKRYKRFLADIELENGSIITAHCPNTGSMKTCLGDHWPVRLSSSQNQKRKYPYTLELIHNGKCWIGVNTHLSNYIVIEAIEQKRIPELIGYKEILSEKKYGNLHSRIDILLKKEDNARCYIEVKNVTLVEDNIYMFPDSITKRGQKHLNELMQMVKEGHRGIIFFLIQRSDGTIFKPASHIDPEYGKLLKLAQRQGVEVLAYQTTISPSSITLSQKIKTQI